MKLPELGENIEGGDVLRVMVKPGDSITKDQAVLELETDKATIEVPSSATGVVKEVKIKPGEKVKVGQTIFVVDEASSPSKNGGTATTAQETAPEPASAAAKPEPPKPETPKAETAKSSVAQGLSPVPEKRKADVVEMKPSKRGRASLAEAGRAREGGGG